MSTLFAVLIIAAVLAFSLAGGYWQIQRAQQTCEDARTGVIEEGRISGSFAPKPRAAEETRPGTDFAEQDALELLYSIPAYGPDLDARLERLRKAVRDEQQNGEARDA